MKTLSLLRGSTCLVPHVLHARYWHQRLFGLLLLPRLGQGHGLLIEPCASVHTLGMRYPLDLLFLSPDNQVLGWRENLAPWRAASLRGARSTLELPAGALTAMAPQIGERLRWQAAPASHHVHPASGGFP